jgi:FMN phosphatase YigB (HAD superfamily)
MGVAPEEALMVGDSLRADVAGAQVLGMTAVWKRNHSSEDDEERPLTLPNGQGPVVVVPDYTIETLGELPGIPIFG